MPIDKENLDVALQAVDVAEEALRRAKRAVEAAQNEPEEPPPGTIIWFDVQYNYGAQVYSFVATRIADTGWWITGKTNPFSWKRIVETMRRDVYVKNGENPLIFYTCKKPKFKQVTIPI
jgi:hypothetical protein